MEKQFGREKDEFEELAEHIGKSHTAYQLAKTKIHQNSTEEEQEQVCLELYGKGMALLNGCALLTKVMPDIRGLASKLNIEQIEAEVEEVKKFLLHRYKEMRARGYGL